MALRIPQSAGEIKRLPPTLRAFALYLILSGLDCLIQVSDSLIQLLHLPVQGFQLVAQVPLCSLVEAVSHKRRAV